MKFFRSPFARLEPVIGWLALMRFVGALGFALSMPFLAIYLHEELGISMSWIGVMLTVAGVVGALASTVGGALSDRFGRRDMLIWLLALRGVSFLIMGYLVWAKSPFAVFSAVYIFSSMLGTSIFPLTDAIVADVTTAEKRAEAYGIMRVTANLGWALGPAIGGALAILGFHWLFVATAFALAGASVLVVFTISETVIVSPDSSSHSLLGPVLNDKRLLIFMAVGLVMFLARGQLISTLSVHLSETVKLSKGQIGLLYGLNGALVAALQVPTTKYTVRFNPLSALAFAGVLYGVGYFLVGLASSMTDMITAISVITAAEMIETPTAATYVTELAPEGLVGAYLGAFHFVFHLGWTVGPMVGGVLLDVMPDPLYAWTAIAGLAVAGGVGFRLLKERA